jgi:hypothetical protein
LQLRQKNELDNCGAQKRGQAAIPGWSKFANELSLKPEPRIGGNHGTSSKVPKRAKSGTQKTDTGNTFYYIDYDLLQIFMSWAFGTSKLISVDFVLLTESPNSLNAANNCRYDSSLGKFKLVWSYSVTSLPLCP